MGQPEELSCGLVAISFTLCAARDGGSAMIVQEERRPSVSTKEGCGT